MRKWRRVLVGAVAVAFTVLFFGKAEVARAAECTEHVYDYTCDHKCNVCEEYRVVNHYYGTECSNENYCWRECACGRITEYRRHYYETESSKWCLYCGYKREGTHEFTLKGQDELFHWEACECGAGREKKLHTYSSGKCTYCGYEKPEWYIDGSHREKDGEVYVTLEAAAAYARQRLVERDANMEIRFYFELDKPLQAGDAERALYEEICRHTGKANEGAVLWNTWVGTSTTEDVFDGGIHYYTIKNWCPEYTTTVEQEQWLTEEIHRIFKELKIDTMTDYDKIYAIYKYICDHVSYGHEINHPMWNNSHTKELVDSYWALKTGYAICDGYGDLVYRMMMEAGIDTRIISGTVGFHEWNIVKLDGKYYCVDATNDAGQDEYYNFLLGLSEFRGNTASASHWEDPEFHTEEFWAECPVSFTSYGKTLPQTGEIAASGEGFDGIKWELSKNGVLTIRGTGKIDFPYWMEWKGFIKKVIVAEGFTEIGLDAFSYCPALEEVVIPSSVTILGERAFCYCDRLKSVFLPKGLTSVGASAFEGCNSLKEVILPEGVEYVGEGAFRMCYSLERVVLGKEMKKIEKETFWRSEKLREVVMYEGIEEIGNSAFQECTGLEKISFPNTLKVLGDEVFRDAFSYKAKPSLVLPESITSIGTMCFEMCNIGELVWNASVSSIGLEMFDECRCLERVVLGDSVTKLDKRAFGYCDNLQTIIWPSNLTEVGDEAFINCMSLKSVEIPNTISMISKMMFYRCSGLQSIVIPEGVTRIGEMAFGECTSLPEVTIPASVEKLGKYAFSWCNFDKVVFEGAPPSGSEAFGSFFGTAYYWADRGEWTEKAMKRLCNSGGATWVNMLDAGKEPEKPATTATPEPTEVPDVTPEPTKALEPTSEQTPEPTQAPSEAQDAGTPVKEKESNDNTEIIVIIIAVVAVVLIGGVGIGFAVKKKKQKK